MSEQTNYLFYFTGTGNSYYVAKKINDKLENSVLYAIKDGPPKELLGGKGLKIGFIFPVYYGILPRIVKKFIENLIINSDTYIFSVFTSAGFGIGTNNSVNELLNLKKCKLSYGASITMPANYVIKYNPANASKCGDKFAKADLKIDRIIAAIVSKQTNKIGLLKIKSNTLYKNIESLDDKFSINSKCTCCGLCEKICPVNNIKIESNKPVWQKHCEHCVACISWCPSKAIDYGDKTALRRRYVNPLISVNDLI